MFDNMYRDATHWRGSELPVSPHLKGLLEAFYRAISNRPVDQDALEDEVARLLHFLTTPEGRTDANCRAVDYFICTSEWGDSYPEELPDRLNDIIADMGGALHDTVNAPDIARNFESTPEQLLERLRKNADADANSP